MFESAVSLAVWEAGVYFTTGEIARPAGSAHKLLAPYQAVAASDGHFIIGATTPPNWTACCRVLGLEALEHDRRYLDGTARRRNREALIASIEKVTRTRPAAHWLSLLREAGVPCGEIGDYGDVFNDPHLAARGFFTDLPHPTLGAVRGLGSPVRLARTPVRHRRAGALLGEHSREVLMEVGCAGEEVARLVADGVVKA
jgi:formyl-CoA transferase